MNFFSQKSHGSQGTFLLNADYHGIKNCCDFHLKIVFIFQIKLLAWKLLPKSGKMSGKMRDLFSSDLWWEPCTYLFIFKITSNYLLIEIIITIFMYAPWLTLWGLGTWNFISPKDWALFGHFLFIFIKPVFYLSWWPILLIIHHSSRAHVPLTTM